MLAISSLLSSSCNVGHVAASIRFRDGNARALLARQEIGEKAFLELFASVFNNRRYAESESGIQGASRARQTRTSQLFTSYQYFRPRSTEGEI